MVKKGQLLTPHADSCLPGITRGVVLELAGASGMAVIERNISIAEIYTADELFTTGTVGELSPVLEVDGRRIGDGQKGPLTNQLQMLFAQRVATGGEPLE